MEINGKIKTRREVTGKISTAALHGTVAVDGGATPSVQGEDTIHGRVTTTQDVGGNLGETSALSGEIDDNVKNRLLKDYNILINKPQINGVELKGNKTSTELGIPVLYSGTVEYWNSHPTLVGEKDAVYVYTDYSTDSHGNEVPGIKIGDGLSYLIDSPFLDVNCRDHMDNTEIHITQIEREFWNSKANIYCDTTANWAAQPTLESEKDAIYVYTDHQQLDGVDIPGIKIGDGNAYLVDLPFIDAVYAEHIANSIIHVTQEDRNVWDNNVTCFISPNKEDRLVFKKR